MLDLFSVGGREPVSLLVKWSSSKKRLYPGKGKGRGGDVRKGTTKSGFEKKNLEWPGKNAAELRVTTVFQLLRG